MPPLRAIGYAELRRFTHRALTALAGERSDVKGVVLTLHGPGFGLDEIEAFESELAGIVDAVHSNDLPPSLERVVFAERNPGRATRLAAALDAVLPGGRILLADADQVEGAAGAVDQAEQFRSVGWESDSKDHVFVAMPFDSELDDTYRFGIQGPVRAAGFLCERADELAYTGNVVEVLKQRIQNAALVVAEVTDANPNVYLEIGYAWGQNAGTVLLVKGDPEEVLAFDLEGQRCLSYEKITHLEELMTNELALLKQQLNR